MLKVPRGGLTGAPEPPGRICISPAPKTERVNAQRSSVTLHCRCVRQWLSSMRGAAGFPASIASAACLSSRHRRALDMRSLNRGARGRSAPMLNLQPANQPVVNSYNEWDPLEEVIVGSVESACVPPWSVALEATMPESEWSFFHEHGGKPFPAAMIAAARRELDELVHVLE